MVRESPRCGGGKGHSAQADVAALALGHFSLGQIGGGRDFEGRRRLHLALDNDGLRARFFGQDLCRFVKLDAREDGRGRGCGERLVDQRGGLFDHGRLFERLGFGGQRGFFGSRNRLFPRRGVLDHFLCGGGHGDFRRDDDRLLGHDYFRLTVCGCDRDGGSGRNGCRGRIGQIHRRDSAFGHGGLNARARGDLGAAPLGFGEIVVDLRKEEEHQPKHDQHERGEHRAPGQREGQPERRAGAPAVAEAAVAQPDRAADGDQKVDDCDDDDEDAHAP